MASEPDAAMLGPGKRGREDEEAREKELEQRNHVLAATKDEGLRAFMQWSFSNSDKGEQERDRQNTFLRTLDSNVDKTSKDVAAVQADVKQLQDAQQTDSQRISKLEEQIRAGSTGSGSSTRTGFSSKYFLGSTFQSSYVEAYGWIKDWSSKQQIALSMIADSEASKLLENILKFIETSDKLAYDKIDLAYSRRLIDSKPTFASVRVRFKAGTESTLLWTVQASLQKWLQDDASAVFKDMLSPLHRLKFRVESPPWKTPHIQANGRFWGCWSRAYTGPRINLKTVTGAGKTPSEVWSDPVEGQRDLLATFEAKEYGGTGEWVVHDDHHSPWKKFCTRHRLQIQAEAFQEQLRTRRS